MATRRTCNFLASAAFFSTTALPAATSPNNQYVSLSPYLYSTPLCPNSQRHNNRGQLLFANPVMRSKRRPRSRSSSQPPSPSSEPKPTPAPRVNRDTSTLNLRQQLKLARENVPPPQHTRPVVRTKFRRKKDDAARSGKAHCMLDSVPEGKYAIDKDPILFIDAYNVIGAWPRLRKSRDNFDMGTARRLLVHDVTEYAHLRGWDCVLVFDAQGTPEHTKVQKTPQKVTLIYTGSETADTYIERQVFEMCKIGERQVWAATSDFAQLNFSKGSGAHVMTSTLFIQEIKRARRESIEKVSERDESCARGKMLMSNVSEETRNRLYELRDRLDGP